jgi:hypothetical protein
MDEVPSMPKVKVLRTFRVLRPLRTLSRSKSMRLLVHSLLSALPSLANVVVLLLFFFCVFGMIAVQLWGASGVLYGRCRLTPYPVQLPLNYTFPLDDEVLAASYNNATITRCGGSSSIPLEVNSENWTKSSSPWATARECAWPLDISETLVCDFTADHMGLGTCPAGQTCGSNFDSSGNARFADQRVMDAAMFIPDLHYGFTSFDDFAKAFLTIFQLITLESWTTVFYQIQDGYHPIVGAIYCISIVIFGNFFLLNLTLASISQAFSTNDAETNQREHRALIRAIFDRLDDIQFGSITVADVQRVHGFQNLDRSYMVELCAEHTIDPETIDHAGFMMLWKALKREYASGASKPMGIGAGTDTEKSSPQSSPPTSPRKLPASPVAAASLEAELSNVGGSAAPTGDTIGDPATRKPSRTNLLRTGSLFKGLVQPNEVDGEQSALPRTIIADLPPEGLSPTRKGTRASRVFDAGRRLTASFRSSSKMLRNAFVVSHGNSHGNQGSGCNISSKFFDFAEMCCARCCASLPAPVQWVGEHVQDTCAWIAEHAWFNRAILFLIVLNTICLSLERYGQPLGEKQLLEDANFFLTLFFLAELVIKLIGLGPRSYAQDSFNLFDAAIVIISLVEFAIDPPFIWAENRGVVASDGQESGSGVGALRTFRLMRVLKIMRQFPRLQALMKTILQILDAVSNFAILIALYMYIFSLLGMQLFANVFRFDSVTGYAVAADAPIGTFKIPRQNFDDLLFSFLCVFQCLGGLNWNQLMYDGIRANEGTITPPALYFVTVMVVGNFILLNLFLCILLIEFQRTAEAEQRKLREDNESMGRHSTFIEGQEIHTADLVATMQNDSRMQEDNVRKTPKKVDTQLRTHTIWSLHGDVEEHEVDERFGARVRVSAFRRSNLKSR